MAETIPTTMGAVVIEGPRRASRQWVPTPEWGEDEVLIRVEGCGVCGSNLPAWEGRPWFRYPLPPGNPGHEGWGVVVRAGRQVTSVALGDRVSFLSDRAFADYATASPSSLCVLPASLAKSPFPGEALGCIMNIFRRAQIRAGQKVAVVGAGFIGAGLVALASRVGAHVAAISRRPWALDLASRLGAKDTFVMGDDDFATVRALMDFSGGEGFHQAIEAVGAQRTLNLASQLVATQGRLVIAGQHQDGLRQVDMQSWNTRGIDVINAHERDPAHRVAGMRAAADAVCSGALDLTELITHRFELADVASAFTTLEQRPEGFLKAVLSP